MNILRNLLLIFCFLGFTVVVNGQEVESAIEINEDENKILQVSTIVREPFVVQDGPELAGFSIDLWNLIVSRNGWQAEYVVEDRFVDLLNSVKEPARSDAAIANISITSDREQIMDFSTSIFNGGLQVLVPTEQGNSNLFKALFTYNMLLLTIVLLAMFIFLGYVMSRIATVESWRKSLKNSYWNLITFGQYGEALPKDNSARGFFVLWIIVITIFVITATSEVTSTMIASKTGTDIQSYLDLQNKKVGVSAGSTSENYMRANGISTVSFDSLDEMFGDLIANKIDAVVHDAPVVQHYATYSGRGDVVLVGDVFNKEQYGIALPEGSPLRGEINTTLLQIQEDGTYQNLYNKWFNK